MLALELEGNFKNKLFPSLDLASMKEIVKKYEKDISQNKIKTFKANLDFLTSSLNVILTAFQPREFISFYLLASYLRKYKAHTANLINEFAEYAVEFLKNLYLFSIYDTKPPPGMKKIIFDLYKTYKLESKVMTTSESLNKRIEIMLVEYDRLNTIITKDPNRLFDVEQKRTLYFRQKGSCGYCGRNMVFSLATGHHIIAHSKGGRTADLDKSVLLHENCHKQVEKQIFKGKDPVFLFSSVKTIS
ncbi:HNH endonuclease [Chloroflexota bacterium]